MKRIISVPAVIAGVLGTMLTGAGPATAAGSTVDCSTGDYTWSVNQYFPTNVETGPVDNRSYNMSAAATYTYDVCLDIPDGETFTIVVRRFTEGGIQTVFVDDRPGDKVFRYSLPPSSLWQVDGMLTGSSPFLYYTWREKRTIG